MNIEINFIAVVIATVVTMILGYIWYLPQFFGGAWMKLAHINIAKLNSNFALGSATLSLLLMAWGLAIVAYMFHAFLHNSFLIDSILAGLFVWLSFQALRILQLAEFNQRSHIETAIHVGNELMTVMVMALIIGIAGY